MAINFSGNAFYSTLIEIVGFKCGIALNQPELRKILIENEYEAYASYHRADWVRIDSVEIEEIIYDLMKHFGRLAKDFSPFPTIAMFHKYKRDPERLAIYYSVMKIWDHHVKTLLHKRAPEDKSPLDPTPAMREVFAQHGMLGVDLLMEAIRGINAALLASPWGQLRETEWKSELELRQLFDSEGLNAEYGKFFDQRYIDYLHQNFPNLDRIHWRKFEQFTAEYLDRQGYKVELGPGRGDDGVDVRAWSQDGESRPQIIVQCKRQKAAVEKVVVKALYADVVHEQATSGLLVTTSRLSLGAEETRTARSYPVSVADRETLQKWFSQLRKPGIGEFEPANE